MEFAVEAWDPDYGTGGDADAIGDTTDVVETGLEVPTSQWRPLTPPQKEVGTVFFVDGVRRIDARIWVTSNGRVLPGSCATVAAGSVRCVPGLAEIHEVAVRHIVLTPPVESAASISTEFGLYHHVEISSGSPEDLYLGIHEEMTRLESETIPTTTGPEDIIVFDGPLRGRTQPGSVGLIKTQHVHYLDVSLQGVVHDLAAGDRTPLFAIGSGRFRRWSWYLRLPGPRTHGWAGVVRCEMPVEAPSPESDSDASDRADRVAASLPRFASEPHKEHRAPQNLYPISGLERTLRSRLGDQRLLQRALRQAAQNPASLTTPN